MICCSSHGGAPVLLPESRRKEFTLPEKTLPRPVGGIMGDFLSACKAGGGPTFSGFASFSGPCLEMLLVGHLAMRAGLNKPVEWDGVEHEVDEPARAEPVRQARVPPGLDALNLHRRISWTNLSLIFQEGE